jgi:hypothetical protein
MPDALLSPPDQLIPPSMLLVPQRLTCMARLICPCLLVGLGQWVTPPRMERGKGHLLRVLIHVFQPQATVPLRVASFT